MSAQAAASLPLARRQAAGRHHVRMVALCVLLCAMVLALILYGFDYYLLDNAARPFSAKHPLLRPSGRIGLILGQLGLLLFLGLYLYPIRKAWPWLARKGNPKHWLDVHIFLGVAAPCVVAFHTSFKFQGVAGVAFWIMVAVALSGIVGRYIYAQIPRSLSAAELSLKEIQEQQQQVHHSLQQRPGFCTKSLQRVLAVPLAADMQEQSAVGALVWMVWLDVVRLFRVAALRRESLSAWSVLATGGGLLASRDAGLEETIRLARRQASLAKRVLFLERAHQLFHMWHVVHRPFSYSFAVMAAIHIIVVMLFGLA